MCISEQITNRALENYNMRFEIESNNELNLRVN